jgi:hypothetical protein
MAKRCLTFRRWFYLFLPIFTSFLILVNPVSAGSLTYTYDDLNRLIMAEYSDDSVIEFTYDAVGNRETKEVTPGNTCEGDFDNDGDVDGSDLAVLAADFGRTDCSTGDPCGGDFNHDGDVDGSDLAVFAADFGRTDCP